MDFLLIAFLTLLNGLFAMSEMRRWATTRRSRLAAMAEDDGDRGAQTALKLMDQPTQFLSTVQVGITSIGVVNGIIGEAAFSAGVAQWLQGVGVPQRFASVTATAIVVAIITYITIIFGELVPKRIGQIHPERIARWMARPMHWLSRAAGPFVKLLSASTQATLRLLAIKPTPRMMTQEEITHSLEEGVDAGVIEQHEHQMVRNVFHLDDRALASMMVPRTEVRWLDATTSVREALRRAGEGEGEAHSWYPVCRGSLDDVVGVVSVSRLISLGPQHEGPIEPHALPALFVPETLTGMELLEQFRMQPSRIVFVVDEYGVVQGLITPHDLLEAITGELRPAGEATAWATQREDGSWLLEGLMPVSELKARLDIRDLPEEDKGRYNTLAGLLMAVSGHLPGPGERIDCGDWVFEVVDLDGVAASIKVLAQEPSRKPADAAAG